MIYYEKLKMTPVFLVTLLPLISFTSAALIPYEGVACSAEELQCQNGQSAYKDCNDQCFCECTDGFAGTKCEITVTAELCNDCIYNNGRYIAGVPGYCDLYVMCTPLGDETDIHGKPLYFSAAVMPCQGGTMYVTFPDGTMGCGHPTDGVCEYDQCKSLPVGSGYSDSRSCQGYWECGVGCQTVSQGCCPAGTAFNSANQSCEVDPTCAVTCGPDQPEVCHDDGECNFGVSSTDAAIFFHMSVPYQTQSCPPGFVFDLDVCTCVGTDQCEATVSMDFETDSVAYAEDVVERITVKNFQNVSTHAGNFQGEDNIILKSFAGSGFYTSCFKILAKVRIPKIHCGSEKQAVVTNADCDVEESVSITVDGTNVYFKINQMKVDGAAEIAIPYAGLDSFGWYDIALEYKKPEGQGYFTFTGTVGSVTAVYDGHMTNYIDTRVCAMHIGYGYKYLGLVGAIDDVEVWRCC